MVEVRLASDRISKRGEMLRAGGRKVATNRVNARNMAMERMLDRSTLRAAASPHMEGGRARARQRVLDRVVRQSKEATGGKFPYPMVREAPHVPGREWAAQAYRPGDQFRGDPGGAGGIVIDAAANDGPTQWGESGKQDKYREGVLRHEVGHLVQPHLVGGRERADLFQEMIASRGHNPHGRPILAASPQGRAENRLNVGKRDPWGMGREKRLGPYDVSPVEQYADIAAEGFQRASGDELTTGGYGIGVPPAVLRRLIKAGLIPGRRRRR